MTDREIIEFTIDEDGHPLATLIVEYNGKRYRFPPIDYFDPKRPVTRRELRKALGEKADMIIETIDKHGDLPRLEDDGEVTWPTSKHG